MIDNVATWYHCSIECRKQEDCAGWSFVTNAFAVSTSHGRCHLKNSNYKTGRKTWLGVVSGDKTCAGEDFIVITLFL